MTRPVLTTSRIELRPMRPEHLELLHVLDTDPEVMRFLLGRARTPAEIEQFWGPRCADTSGDAISLGWWVGFDRRTGEFLGWWDLARSDSDIDSAPTGTSAEIGWRVRRSRWREGLATEAARELLRHGFDTVGLDLIWAETMAVNAGSRGVMRAIGMRHVSTQVRAWEDPIDGWEQGEVRYELTAHEWRSQQVATVC